MKQYAASSGDAKDDDVLDFRALKNALLKNNIYQGNISVTQVFEFVGAELMRYIFLQIIFCS